MTSTQRRLDVPFVDLKAQHAALAGEIEPRLREIMANAQFILGPDVGRFEEEFAAYCGAGHAVGLDNGTSALELALRAFGVGPGDEVITVANSFIVSASVVSFVGATPVLVDCGAEDYLIDVDAIERAITPRTKAIIPVHLYGQVADMARIMALAERRGLFVLEDACQAHGATYEGRRAGGLGHAAAFSFYPSKNLGAYGDAGALTTDDARVAERVRMLRDYGQRSKYDHQFLAYNRRLDTMQAAVLRAKLPHLDDWNAARRAHAARYRAQLADTGVVTPAEVREPGGHVYHLFVVLHPDRDGIQRALTERGVQSGRHYPIPIHRQQAFAFLDLEEGRFPNAERVAREGVTLPMYPELTEEQIDYVCDTIRDYLHG
ncbi:MAG TPA: DegT/DnrJ/EryC1/StrS family aminotransferase [Thermomicrobiales bacterium]|nr:DegT/DnrJ/EryC1/StrS family aminotransferase [Thermomicrobiales bacterium]